MTITTSTKTRSTKLEEAKGNLQMFGYKLEDVCAIIAACQAHKVVAFKLYGLELKFDVIPSQDRPVAGDPKADRRILLEQRGDDVEAHLDLLKIEDPAEYERYIANEDN